MLNTPLTQLRRSSPLGFVRVKDVAEYFAKRRHPRTEQLIGDFERGKVLKPTDRFLELYAQAIGTTVEAVQKAHKATLRSSPTRSKRKILTRTAAA
ncbi:MAG TPA: hypothetical protein VJY35_15535 [Candidatus Eisenbacteria bacterium]|nr:hypothetical protein [Candidatus Eisenbacteria bacterium]